MPFMLFKHNNNVTKINFFLLKTSKGPFFYVSLPKIQNNNNNGNTKRKNRVRTW